MDNNAQEKEALELKRLQDLANACGEWVEAIDGFMNRWHEDKGPATEADYLNIRIALNPRNDYHLKMTIQGADRYKFGQCHYLAASKPINPAAPQVSEEADFAARLLSMIRDYLLRAKEESQGLAAREIEPTNTITR